MDTSYEVTLHGGLLKYKNGDVEQHYSIFQIQGQKHVKLVGSVQEPDPDAEVYAGGVPRSMTIDEIFKFFVQCGEIYQLRLLMDFSGCNRGQCFVHYKTILASREAICCLHKEMIEPETTVIIKKSLNNNQLKMKSVPAWLSINAFSQYLQQVIGEGLKEILVAHPNPHNKDFNCFCIYENHRSAVKAHKIAWPNLNAFGAVINVQWATPEIVRKSRSLYFTNFPPDMTRREFFDVFVKNLDLKSVVDIDISEKHGMIKFTNEQTLRVGYDTISGIALRGVHLELSRDLKQFDDYDDMASAAAHEDAAQLENAVCCFSADQQQQQQHEQQSHQQQQQHHQQSQLQYQQYPPAPPPQQQQQQGFRSLPPQHYPNFAIPQPRYPPGYMTATPMMTNVNMDWGRYQQQVYYHPGLMPYPQPMPGPRFPVPSPGPQAPLQMYGPRFPVPAQPHPQAPSPTTPTTTDDNGGFSGSDSMTDICCIDCSLYDSDYSDQSHS